MIKRTIAVALSTAVAFSFAVAPASAADKDCSDFRTWRQAQNFYKKHGGPKHDPHRLDGDDDGIACERLRGYSY